MSSPSLVRIFTAPSSSRSRLSVAWVTLSPSSASSLASWLCDRTACRPRMSTILRCRAVRVCGTACPGPCDGEPAIVSSICVALPGGPVPLTQDAGQHLEKRVRLVVADDQRRGEPYRTGNGRVHQQSGVLSRLLDLRGQRLGEHDTDQQAGTADMIDQRVSQRLDALPQFLALALDVVQQAVGGDGVEHGEGGGAGHRITAEGGAVGARGQQVGG